MKPEERPAKKGENDWKIVYIPVGVDERGEYINYKTAVQTNGEKK